MNFIRDLPSTNYRIFVTVLLFAITILSLLVFIYIKIELPAEIVVAIFVAELGMAGVDYKQFAKKRDTYQPAEEPPMPQKDIEDVATPEEGYKGE